jgi:hypothetical protein
MSHQSADPLSAAVNEEILRLKALDFSQLINLPESTERQVFVDTKPFTLTIWHDVLPSGEHRVVAQACRVFLFGIGGAACADGFSVSTEGKLRELTGYELVSFT